MEKRAKFLTDDGRNLHEVPTCYILVWDFLEDIQSPILEKHREKEQT